MMFDQAFAGRESNHNLGKVENEEAVASAR
jgi:hypothetical protein